MWALGDCPLTFEIGPVTNLAHASCFPGPAFMRASIISQIVFYFLKSHPVTRLTQAKFIMGLANMRALRDFFFNFQTFSVATFAHSSFRRTPANMGTICDLFKLLLFGFVFHLLLLNRTELRLSSLVVGNQLQLQFDDLLIKRVLLLRDQFSSGNRFL